MDMRSVVRGFGRGGPSALGATPPDSPPPAAPPASAGAPPAALPPPQPEPSWVGPVVVLGVFGIGALVAYSMWANYKIVSGIAQKEGSTGILKYEAGTAGIGVLSDLAHHEIND